MQNPFKPSAAHVTVNQSERLTAASIGGSRRYQFPKLSAQMSEGDCTEEVRRRWQRLVVLRQYGGDNSTIDVTLTPAGESTTLTLRHRVPDNEHWSTYGPAAPGIGWDSALLALSLFIAGDDRSHPEEMAKLNATDEGKDFIAQTADSWQAAHTTSGADPVEARDMASRTAAFYREEG